MLIMLAYLLLPQRTGTEPKAGGRNLQMVLGNECRQPIFGARLQPMCPRQTSSFFEALARNPVRRFRYDPQVEMVDVRKAQYASRTAITSAVYNMLMRRGPVYLLDKGLNEIPVQRYSTRANRKDRHHIFPRQPLTNAEMPAKLYNSISNVCLLVAEENQKIGFKRPRTYLDELNGPGSAFRRKINRHLIPVDDVGGVWDRNLKRGFRRFLGKRTMLICDALEDEAGIRLFRPERHLQ